MRGFLAHLYVSHARSGGHRICGIADVRALVASLRTIASHAKGRRCSRLLWRRPTHPQALPVAASRAPMTGSGSWSMPR